LITGKLYASVLRGAGGDEKSMGGVEMNNESDERAVVPDLNWLIFIDLTYPVRAVAPGGIC